MVPHKDRLREVKKVGGSLVKIKCTVLVTTKLYEKFPRFEAYFR